MYPLFQVSLMLWDAAAAKMVERMDEGEKDEEDEGDEGDEGVNWEEQDQGQDEEAMHMEPPPNLLGVFRPLEGTGL